MEDERKIRMMLLVESIINNAKRLSDTDYELSIDDFWSALGVSEKNENLIELVTAMLHVPIEIDSDGKGFCFTNIWQSANLSIDKKTINFAISKDIIDAHKKGKIKYT